MNVRLACVLMLSSLVACGGDDNNDKPADAAPQVPQKITVAGSTKQVTAGGASQLTGVSVGAYKRSDDTMLATATSDSNGNFTMDIDTGGEAVDGYLKASISGNLDTYLYPPAKLAADFSGATMNLVASSTVKVLAQFCGTDNFDATMKGFLGLEVVDASGNPVAGAAVVTTPAPAGGYCYDSGPIPKSTATVTDTDGLAYALDITGDIAITATKSGMTFGTVNVKERVGSLTTTQIVGQ